MFCIQCGTRLGEEAAFCHSCGARVPTVPVSHAKEPVEEVATQEEAQMSPLAPPAAKEPVLSGQTPVEREAPAAVSSDPAPASVQPETRWIKFRDVYMWSSADPKTAADAGVLPKGARVSVLEKGPAGKVRVIAEDGTEGWVNNVVLSSRPVAQDAPEGEERQAGTHEAERRHYARRDEAAAPPAGGGAGPIVAAIITAAIILGMGFGGRAIASQLADEGSGCWEMKGGEVGIYLWCAGNSHAGGYCAGLVNSGDMNGGAVACATPALLIQKIPAAGLVGIALGIGASGFFIANALAGRRRLQT